MKSPDALSLRLKRQWESADKREARLLDGERAWPIEVSIGRPKPSVLVDDLDSVRSHIERWRQVSIGEVVWQAVRYRAAADEVEIPVSWKLRGSTEWIDACRDRGVRSEFESIIRLIQQTDEVFHSVFVRRRSLWGEKELAEVIQASQLAMALTPGCAEGRPLRLLSLAGIDTKFFERHSRLVTALLDARYDGEVSRIGLESFLGALVDGDHWLLLVDLDGSLLPFRRQRVRSSELSQAMFPGERLLIIENESCHHQLPCIPGTLAVLGTGFDLDWIKEQNLSSTKVGYWGDIDTWGLHFLAAARRRCSHLDALMMNSEVYQRFHRSAVVEPVIASTDIPLGLTESEQDLYNRILREKDGRLEQEFLPQEFAQATILAWADESNDPNLEPSG